jgi:hypothetical protein
MPIETCVVELFRQAGRQAGMRDTGIMQEYINSKASRDDKDMT